jgi:integrase
MSLYKRKDSPYWWIKVSVNGHRVQKSTGTTDKQKAEEYHDKLKAQIWDELRLGRKQAHVWNEAVVRWLKERVHKATHKEDITQLKRVHKFLDGVELSNINRDLLCKIQDNRLADGVSNSTVNRTLEVIRAILRRARDEWEWLDKAPKVPMLPEPKQRVRWLTRDEAEMLLVELPSHLAALVRFSLETGLRQRNVTMLEWSQVDIERRCAWIHPDQAKARKAIPVPLTATALFVLRQQRGKNPNYVFTYKGNPIRQPNNWAWRKALKRAGIENFRWHDLRHTWASWHAQAGTPMYVLQELGGWSCLEMVRKYAHLSSEHLTEHADKMSTIWLQTEATKKLGVAKPF